MKENHRIIFSTSLLVPICLAFVYFFHIFSEISDVFSGCKTKFSAAIFFRAAKKNDSEKKKRCHFVQKIAAKNVFLMSEKKMEVIFICRILFSGN